MNLRRLSLILAVSGIVIFGIIQTSCTSTDKIDNQDYTSYDVAIRSLATRLLSDNASLFRFKLINDADSIKNDAFEIDSEGGKITISGNNTVAIASGLNWYLKNYCHCQISLNYNQLDLPDPLPIPEEKIRIETPFEYRYFFNYCTYGYSMPWWGWEKWEEVIDYMALMGINMPLAPIGQEAIWEEVYKNLGLSDKQLDEFFVGPAHLPWGRMGNIDGLGGPLPQNWIKLRKELQKKILNRMRSYGMKPVLQGFTGHVPKELKDIYPNADIEQINDWAGIPGTMFLSPTDSLFAYIGKSFIERQTETYGTNHLYDADCFIEVDPPSKDPEYLAGVSKAVYESMASADPDAIWVMQGWFFFFKKDFWQTEQGRAFVGAVPENKLIVLDLYGEKNTTWDKTEAFFGQPWIWNVICNEDQKVNISGDLQQMQINFDEAFQSEINNNLVGVGTIPEGLGYNPIVQEFIYEKAWNQSTVDINSWIRNYAKRRYGTDNPSALEAWEELYASVYSRTRTLWNPLITTPRLQIFKGPAEDIRHVRKDIVITGDNPLGMDFNVSSLYKAAEKLIACEEELNKSESYRFDLVNIHRELLSSLSHLFIHNLSESYKNGDIEEFDLAAENILGLIYDLERVTATHEMFSLPAWIEGARSWGLTPQEADYYETNARTIITIWQPWKEGSLRDYAGKQWSGLFKTYYYPRWELFISHLEKSLKENSTFEYKNYDKAIRDMDYAWINSKETIKTETDQDLFSTIKEINNKYKKYFTQ